jgi:hypothetical protein
MRMIQDAGTQTLLMLRSGPTDRVSKYAGASRSADSF